MDGIGDREYCGRAKGSQVKGMRGRGKANSEGKWRGKGNGRRKVSENRGNVRRKVTRSGKKWCIRRIGKRWKGNRRKDK
jgi:hypothetical protein